MADYLPKISTKNFPQKRKINLITILLIISLLNTLLLFLFFLWANQHTALIIGCISSLFVIQVLVFYKIKRSKTQENQAKCKDEIATTTQKLEKSKRMLIEFHKLRTLGMLTGGIAHEINNPLNFIQGGLEGIENYLKKNNIPTDEKLNLYTDSIQAGIDKAHDLLKKICQFSRNTNSYIEICQIHTIIDNCLQILQNKTKNKIKILRNYTDESDVIRGNNSLLYQVFINLLINSIQAIYKEGYIEITSKLEEGNNFSIQITDNGKGFDTNELAKILNPLENSQDSIGIGLFLVKSILEEHKASFSIHSEEGNGTSVKIILPKK